MIIELTFTETSVRTVRINQPSLQAAVKLWTDPADDDEEMICEEWIANAVEHDGGVDWLSATFREIPREEES
jgi:hypothetical protein